MGLFGNIGYFAGGVAKGYQDQSDRQLKQAQLDKENAFRDRTMQMQEEQQGWTRQEHQREMDQQKQGQDLYNSIYGEQTQDVTDPTTGQTTKQVVNPASAPGQPGPDGLARDLQFSRGAMGIALKNLKDPTQIAPIMDYTRKLAATQQGQDVLKAASGDQGAITKLVTDLGGDPTKARMIDHRTLDLGNGKTQDLQTMLMSVGAYDQANYLQQRHTGDLQDQVANADIGLKRGETALLPAKANVLNAQADMFRDHGDYFANGGRGGAGGPDMQTVKSYTALSKGNPLTSPYSQTGKPEQWTEAEALRGSLFAQAMQKTKNPMQAFQTANSAVSAAMQEARAGAQSTLAAMKAGTIDKNKVAQVYGGTAPGQVLMGAFRDVMQHRFSNTPMVDMTSAAVPQPRQPIPQAFLNPVQ